VDADNLHALDGQGECTTNRRVGTIGFFVANQLSQETLTRVADEQRAAEFVELVAVTHERDVMFMRLTKTDAGVEADSLV
jgi:hypothetical protein